MKLISIDKLNPSTYNPRAADPRRLDLIELSLRKLGFLLPIYATPEGEIISGHQRHHVAQRMGVKEVPVEFTKAMDLPERKGVNVAFNRATNDLKPGDTPENITQALSRVNLEEIAAAVPDKKPDTPEFYPCLKAQVVPIAPLLKANTGRWIQYAASISKTLYLKGVLMPVVATKDFKVVNGIGRLQMQAEQKKKEVAVVFVTEAEARLADAMLNLLSMDFDIHNRYRDLLRYNSFRRLRRVREDLGRGFIFAIAGETASKDFQVTEPKNKTRWIKEHGKSILDFGAGHLHETQILRSIGVRVTPFEPYRVNEAEEIDKAMSLAVVDEFLEDVGEKKIPYNSIFISSVLNSVPFEEDRKHIICICAALCSPQTKLYAVATSTNHLNIRQLRGYNSLNQRQSTGRVFLLEYEPGITLGDVTASPKVQKYHDQHEFYCLFKEFFEIVQVTESNQNVQAICARPKPIDYKKLNAALEFEFDLPYPDGSRMGRVIQAKAAFSERTGLVL
ncbi:MAG: ParB N-terminal domain-containing protein [Alphaproteobacteria bacterium]|nr:ParB N-terminal domain-containing protein [Alphaproteobacteria bacterium]